MRRNQCKISSLGGSEINNVIRDYIEINIAIIKRILGTIYGASALMVR